MDNWKGFSQASEHFLTGKGWLIQLGLTVLLTVIASVVLVQVYKRISLSEHCWRNVVIKALHKPLHFLIWLLGAAAVLGIAQNTWPGIIKIHVADELRDYSILLMMFWFLSRLVSEGSQYFLMPRGDKPPQDETTVHAINKLLQAVVVVIAILMLLQQSGVSISGLVAFGGVGGIAVGFAAKDLLANFFGGLMIYLEKPFKVGDWVRSPEKEIEGTVEYIGWRLTRIKTFDKRPIYVPNSLFTTIVVENPSRMSNRRIKTTVGVRYDDAKKVGLIVQDIKKMVHEHPEIDQDQSIFVNFDSFGASSLNIWVSAYTKTVVGVEFREVQQDVFLKIIDIVDHHGAECAFPTSTIHFFNESPQAT